MKITETMSREERRAAIRKTTENRDYLIAIHSRSNTPAETVAELIGRIGYQAARETIAEAVNARGAWDQRISDRARAWAATIDTAADRETLTAHYLTTDAIHPAHVDQIAEAAAEYDREKPDCASCYDARRVRWFLLSAIAADAQGRALSACLTAHESADRQRMTGSQCRQIIAIYDAWERGWCALEEAQAAAPADQEAPAEEAQQPTEGETVTAAMEAAGDFFRALERSGHISDLKIEPIPAAEEAAPASVTVDSLRADLDTGNYGDRLNDYRDSSSYISDAISEIADSATSIYYSDILAFIGDHPDALADVIQEGLYDPRQEYDLYRHGQAAEYMTIERDIWDHLDDALMVAALDFIQYDLGRDRIPEELADYLSGWVRDPGDRMNEIPDRIREYFADHGEVSL